MSAFRLSLRSFVAFAGTLVLVIGTANSGEAAPGDLDPTFDFDGKVRTDFGGGGDEPLAVAIQPDGKILAAGSTDAASAGTEPNFAVARYHPDGALDPLFGGNGKVITYFGPSGAGARALATQGDGKVLVAGGAWGLSPDGGESFALARYNPDGSLDPTFGGDGRVVTDFTGHGEQAIAVAIQPDGKIVAAGYATGFVWFRDERSRKPTFHDFALARYEPDGSLDPSFGRDGKVTTDFAARMDAVHSLAVLDDGKILAGGGAGTERESDFALARYDSDGSLDPTFGNDGKVTTDFGDQYVPSHDGASAMVIQPDGKIVLAGTAVRFGVMFGLARYNTNGSLDPTFGTEGKVISNLGQAGMSDAAIQKDGKIVAVGVIWTPGRPNFGLARYNTDGSLDPSFGTHGLVITAFDTSGDQATAVAIQRDGKIVAAGTVEGPAGKSDFGLARYKACVGAGSSSIRC